MRRVRGCVSGCAARGQSAVCVELPRPCGRRDGAAAPVIAFCRRRRGQHLVRRVSHGLSSGHRPAAALTAGARAAAWFTLAPWRLGRSNAALVTPGAWRAPPDVERRQSPGAPSGARRALAALVDPVAVALDRSAQSAAAGRGDLSCSLGAATFPRKRRGRSCLMMPAAPSWPR